MTVSIFSLLFLLLLMPVIALPILGVFILVRSKRGPGHPACGACGYNVSVSVGSSARCPECGAAFADVGVRPPRERSTVVFALGLALIIIPLVFGAFLLFSAMLATNARAAQQQAVILETQAIMQADAETD